MPKVQASLNATFLATVYQGELGRDLDATGVSYWGTLLSQTGDRTQVAAGILSSTEYLNKEVWTDYGTLLGRAPDASGWFTFVHALRDGATPQDVQATILGSNEFYARVGGNTLDYLDALYHDVLNRPVDDDGVIHWAPLAGSEAGRANCPRH